jgi:hypothetical protein
MGNTFPLSGGGVDAVEGVFGDGRAPAVRRLVLRQTGVFGFIYFALLNKGFESISLQR